MKIKQFRYSSDNNLAYLLYGDKTAMAIDGGAAEEILSFIETNDLTLKYVTNTHRHMDHTPGDKTLLDRSGAVFFDNDVIKNRAVELEGREIRVYHTPGHSSDSVTFHCGNFLITGDTLFNGKVGRCFSGDLKGFLNSVKFLKDLPGETIIYAGHDYVEEYMAFARKLEPDNPHIERYLKKHDSDHVHSTLDEESRINPFLRFNDKKIISVLEKRGLPVGTEFERWESLMSIM